VNAGENPDDWGGFMRGILGRRDLVALVAMSTGLTAGAGLADAAPSSLDQNKQLVLELFHLFDAQRFDEARKLLHPDFQETTTGASAETFLAQRKGFYSTFPDARHSFDEVIAEGDKVVTTGVISLTHGHTFMGVAATGRKVSMRVWHMNRVRDGKIVSYAALSDMVSLLRQIGALPPGSAF
jgi:predicted ester cyclase